MENNRADYNSQKFPVNDNSKSNSGKKLLGWLIFMLLIFSFPQSIFAQNISINEIMSSNASTLADEDGDFEDWIELYNHGTEPVNLEGFGLSDDATLPLKWTFPNVTLEAGEYLLVWASGKDKKPASGGLEYFNGLKRDVYTGIGGRTVSDLLNAPNYPHNPEYSETINGLFEAPVDVANYYGQRIYGYIRAPQTGYYTFWIASDDNGKLFLSSTSSPADTTLIASVWDWTSHREWDKFPEQQSVPVLLQQGQYYYIIAFMKEEAGGDNLSVGWRLPNYTLQRPISGEHLFISSSEYHTNFKISSEGETVFLNDPQGNNIDSIGSVSLPVDISYGKSPNGSQNHFFFNEPTPGVSNSTQPYFGFMETPVFSESAGFYQNDFDLVISHPDPDAMIYYSLDGSTPDPSNLDGTSYSYKNQYPQNPGHQTGELLYNTYQSYEYSEPIAIYNRSNEPNKISQISTTFENNPWYLPSQPVKKGMVIRAMAMKPGYLPSQMVTNTYFIESQGANPYSLPVITLTTQEDGLFDYYNGIYVAGHEFDKWRINNPGSGSDGGTQANYHMRGDINERQTHFELFESGGAQPVLSQNVGIRMHGGFSRSYPMKSIRVYARSGYGEANLNYPFFKELPYNSYDVLLLRNSGNDFWSTLLRDALIQKTVSHLDFGTQAYQPAVVFLNGEYWGIHNLRERYDDKYIERVYGVDRNNIDLIQNYGSVSEGSIDHYQSLVNFIQSNSLTSLANYENVTNRIDISSFIDYQIANIYASNTDWPGNNIKYWRLRTNEYIPDAPKGHDGRWRWLLMDTDFGYSLYGNNFSHNTLAFATATGGPSWPNPDWSTLFLRKLLENETFKNQFINRFADLLNTTFLPSRITTLITDTRDAIEPEMPNQHLRWTQPAGSINNWKNNVNAMLEFANQRPANQRTHIRSKFGISHQVTLTADVNITAAGKIRVNTIEIDPKTPGVSQNPYPWQGLYFSGIPIEIEAIPAPGYAFSHWEGSSSSSQPLITITPSTVVNLKAHFVQTEESVLVHYWHFNTLIGTVTEVASDYSATGTGMITYPGTGDGYMDERTHRDEDPVSNLNLQIDQQPNQGAVLRVRNPSYTRELIIDAPTSGFNDPKIAFATTRTSNGATQQTLYYSTNGGTTWLEAIPSYNVSQLPVWELKTFDLSDVEDADNNPDLKFKIVFGGENTSLTAGNNRFDNLTLFGVPLTSGVQTFQYLNPSLIIHPNPTRESFSVKSDIPLTESAILQIITLDGSIVKTVEITGAEFSISTQNIPQGIYILKLISDKGISTGRLIKQ